MQIIRTRGPLQTLGLPLFGKDAAKSSGCPYRVLAGVPVIENSVVLVAPQANEFVWVSEVCGGDLLDSVNHFGEVPQVEHVVTLGRRG